MKKISICRKLEILNKTIQNEALIKIKIQFILNEIYFKGRLSTKQNLKG